MMRRPADAVPAGTHSRGFTLIELMLVVLIIGLVYGLALNSIERAAAPSETLTLERLPEYLQQRHKQNHLALICVDRCRACALYADGEKVGEVPPVVDSDAEFYRFDYYRGSEPLAWAPLRVDEGREEEVCFRYDLYPDGSRSEMMVVAGGGVVDLPGYFETPARYASLGEAIDAKQARYEEIRQ